MRRDLRGRHGAPGLRAELEIATGRWLENWRKDLRQHVTVVGIAIVFGLGAYGVIRGLIYVNRLIGLG